VKIYKVKN